MRGHEELDSVSVQCGNTLFALTQNRHLQLSNSLRFLSCTSSTDSFKSDCLKDKDFLNFELGVASSLTIKDTLLYRCLGSSYSRVFINPD